jgi:geranylgeranyl reductase family protein
MLRQPVPSKVEVLIIGAGPAGATLAYELARLGVKVLLLEKAQFPRRKTCGGGLNLRTVRLLPFDLTPIIENVISGIYFSRRLDHPFARRYPEPFMVTVSRDKFDQFLVREAEKAGAFFLDRNPFLSLVPQNDFLQVTTSTGSFSTKFLVGTDGVNSAVARKAEIPLLTSHILAVHSEVPISLLPEQEPDMIHIDWGSLKRGYAYLFPKNNHLSVGAGAFGVASQKIKDYQRAFWAVRWRKEDAPPFSAAGFFLPLRRRRTPIHRGRCLLLGDAAGLVDPFSGEGIYSAVRSAQLAAPYLADFLKNGFSSFQPVQEEIDRTLTPELECSRLFRELFRRWPSYVHRKLRTGDRWWNAMAQILRGEKSNLELKSRMGILGDLLLRLAKR